MENYELIDIYNHYLKIFNDEGNGYRQRPEKLLALLLLSDMSNYEGIASTDDIRFYEHNKTEIDKRIKQVLSDFNFTKNDLIKFIEEKLVVHIENDYRKNVIEYVFKDGISALRRGLSCNKNDSPTIIYNRNFNSGNVVQLKKEKPKPYVRRKVIEIQAKQ